MHLSCIAMGEGALESNICELRTALEARAVAADVAPMARYLKDQFPMLGVRSPAVAEVAKPFIAAGKGASSTELTDAAEALWAQPEREFHYVAVKLLRRWVRALSAEAIVPIERLVTTNSWWDTVDALAARVVGPLVKANPELNRVMDAWSTGPNLWLARTAILHQLMYRDDTDPERLFRYVLNNADSSEFFLRKAIGWALRQYARQEPGQVADFVADNEDRLSGLSKREALKHLG